MNFKLFNIVYIRFIKLKSSIFVLGRRYRLLNSIVVLIKFFCIQIW